MVFQAAEFTKALFTGGFLAGPNAIHPVGGLVFLVVDNVVGELTLLKLAGYLFLLNCFSQDRWEILSSGFSA